MKNPSLFYLSNSVKKFNIVLTIILIGLILFLLNSCSSSPAATQAAQQAPSLPVATIAAGNDTTYNDYPASIEGTVDVEVRPQVSGTLEKVFVDEGAFVKAGEPLFKINDQPYRAALNNAIASEHAAESAAANARLEVEKLTPLVQNKVVSDYQLKTAQAALAGAKANIEQAKANVSTAQINLGYTLIKAPVNGYIGRLLRKQGSLVGPTDPQALTQLSDIHDVHVYFSLSEQDFTSFKEQYPGATLNDKLKHVPSVSLLLADNSIYPKKGKIDMIDGQFDKTTGAISLRATFDNPQGLLRSGNTGKIRLSLLHQNVLKVPQSATLEVQDKVFVFALADSNKVKKQVITIVGKSGNDYLVKDGLKQGDQIVLSGFDHLQEGTAIHPQKNANKLAAN
jgi:membrane fusion protein (multidrug efflux system)